MPNRFALALLITLAMIAAIALTACDPTKTVNKNNANANTGVAVKPPEAIAPETSPEPGFQSCNAYFPLVPGSRLRYLLTYSSGLLADATVVVDRMEQDGKRVLKERTQIVDRSG